MATIDLEKMLQKVKSTQWCLSDIDWNAPGREKITAEQWPKLKDFMADLMWIEHVGARAFSAMSKKHLMQPYAKCMPFSMLKNNAMRMQKWH